MNETQGNRSSSSSGHKVIGVAAALLAENNTSLKAKRMFIIYILYRAEYLTTMATGSVRSAYIIYILYRGLGLL